MTKQTLSKIDRLKSLVMSIDVQISDYESRLQGLKADREGMMREIVRLRSDNLSPIMVV